MTKINIISGFLGAGKTTLIKKLLGGAFGSEKVVLLEHEYGEVGVDSGFMRDSGIQITELNSGCICCTLVGDFSRALDELIDTYHPDRIIIEPSGVGKLSDVIGAVERVRDGGVELELREDEAAEINKETGSDLTAGTQVLNGAQALTYARIRKLDADGDFSRTSRQRKVMSALLSRYRDMQWKDLLPLMDQLLPLISTDMNYGKLVLLAMEILPKLSSAQVTNQRIPADGTFSDEKIDGMAVLSADLEANRQLLRDTLLN